MKNLYIENTLQYTPDLCNGCTMCSKVCPHRVFLMEDGKARLMNPQKCMECGACQKNCSTGAIKVDSGVGCAAAMILQALTRRKTATCGSTKQEKSSCCG